VQLKKNQISDEQRKPLLIVEADNAKELVRIMNEEGKCFPGWSFEEIKEERNSPKIIRLSDYTQYRETLSQMIERITAIADEIQDNLFNLACQGKWKEWEKNQPIGTEFYVDEGMLRNTGDKNIDLLWEVLDKIEEVKKKIGTYK